jgi:hypothetical protein
MGVKGLWSRVLADYDKQGWDFKETLPTNGQTVLLVDASGFMFYLLDTLLSTTYSKISIPREYGGSYQEIEDLFSREIRRLTHTLGFKLMFFFDGGESYYKGNTTAKRRQQLLEKWQNMYFMTANDGGCAQKELPIPALSTTALIHVLDRLKIPFVKSTLEADQDMARACVDFNNNEEDDKEYYCYTADR